RLTPKIEAGLAFLALNTFPNCPEFDFEPCWWRLTPAEQSGDSSLTSNASFVHRHFDAHATHFSRGIEHVLAAERAVEPFGMLFLPRSRAGLPSRSDKPDGSEAKRTSPRRSGARRYTYDVAISFAGPQRPLAEELANRIREAGFKVFYDDFYPER